MAPFLVRAATEPTPCDHPLCDNIAAEGEQVYPARVRDNVYCSHLCRSRHTRIILQHRRTDQPHHREHDNFKKRERKYGITRAKFEALYDKQLGRCAVCLTPLSEVRKVCVDHDHRTRKIRGLLCDPCNQGLGYFKDDPALLMRAAQYVEENKRVRRVQRRTGREEVMS